MRFVKVLVIMISIVVLAGCVEKKSKTQTITFAQDLSFLKKHTDVIIIEDKSGKSMVAVLPTLQGRVMTSTAEGLEGLSFGWINPSIPSALLVITLPCNVGKTATILFPDLSSIITTSVCFLRNDKS